jgi:hypothetical protein
MTNQTVAPPPAELLSSHAAAPEARTLVAEVRSDTFLPFDPCHAPDFKFVALILGRVDVSWSQAQQIQLWLTGAPAGAPYVTREQALKHFFENFQAGTPPATFLEYVGTYLTTDVSHASYTLVLGMRAPVRREDYQAAFQNAVKTLLGLPGGWPGELVSFLKMMLNQPSSRTEFLTLATCLGDLTVKGPPLVRTLIT